MNKYEIKTVMSQANKHFSKSKFDDNPEKWFANNCLVRNEYPLREGEGGVSEMKDMFEELCKNRKIKDVSFFVNRRDFPLLKKNRTEPYECIYGENEPLLSHSYDKYCPILSMNSNDDFEDTSIPTWEDWDRINFKHNKFFPKEFREYKDEFDTPWENKKDVAVFRGQANGRGVDHTTNTRLRISKMRYKYLNAGITKINMRPRFVNGKLRVIDDTQYSTIAPLTSKQQSEYKYIINIEGHSVAYRLSYELSMRSVILLVNCKYKLWYSHLLKEYVHYIPIKEDLSDLIEKIEWCRSNDDKCKQIAENARQFYDTYLSEEGIYNHLENVLNNIDTEPVKSHYKDFSSNYTRMLKKFEIDILGDKIDSHKNVSIYRYGESEYIVKEGDILHEAMIGLKGVCDLENFVKIKGRSSNHVIMEKVKGIRFDQWIRECFNWNEYIKIMVRIFEALMIARDKCEFVHYDLTPWNIIIKEGNIPVIIDFGKSKIKYRGRYYYVYNHCDNTVDIKSIIYKSISIILEKFVTDERIVGGILKLINLFTNKRNVYEVKRFLKVRTNYDNIVFGGKYSIKIENLLEYIKKNIPCKD